MEIINKLTEYLVMDQWINASICRQRHSHIGICCTRPSLLAAVVVMRIETLRRGVVCGAARLVLDTTSAQRPFSLSVEDEQATTIACLPRKTPETVALPGRSCTLIALMDSESEPKCGCYSTGKTGHVWIQLIPHSRQGGFNISSQLSGLRTTRLSYHVRVVGLQWCHCA